MDYEEISNKHHDQYIGEIIGIIKSNPENKKINFFIETIMQSNKEEYILLCNALYKFITPQGGGMTTKKLDNEYLNLKGGGPYTCGKLKKYKSLLDKSTSNSDKCEIINTKIKINKDLLELFPDTVKECKDVANEIVQQINSCKEAEASSVQTEASIAEASIEKAQDITNNVNVNQLYNDRTTPEYLINKIIEQVSEVSPSKIIKTVATTTNSEESIAQAQATESSLVVTTNNSEATEEAKPYNCQQLNEYKSLLDNSGSNINKCEIINTKKGTKTMNKHLLKIHPDKVDKDCKDVATAITKEINYCKEAEKEAKAKAKAKAQAEAQAKATEAQATTNSKPTESSLVATTTKSKPEESLVIVKEQPTITNTKPSEITIGTNTETNTKPIGTNAETKTKPSEITIGTNTKPEESSAQAKVSETTAEPKTTTTNSKAQTTTENRLIEKLNQIKSKKIKIPHKNKLLIDEQFELKETSKDIKYKYYLSFYIIDAINNIVVYSGGT